METMMSGEQIERARKAAERETLAIRLAALRTRRGIKQTDITAFSQTAISKLERRKDMKLSTLIDYLDAIGMGLEIRVYPKNSHVKSETLLRI